MREISAASQTVGPFFCIGLEHLCSDADAPAPAGYQTVRGRVLDGNGLPVPDAMLELWYADRDGHYDVSVHDETGLPRGFIRVATGDDGAFRFCLLQPGPSAVGDGRLQAPHVLVLFFARGLLRQLITRMYFPAQTANHEDPVLQLVPPDRRTTLIATQDPQKPADLTWDIRLQGEEETVFFAW